ncbi:MAG: TIGR02147 family protein [Chitinispirillaceae bacterium]
MKPVFEYSDYRVFLHDYYVYKKKADPSFSHRTFLSGAGMTGPNFLKNVIDGKRNLSRDGIAAFSRALGLKKKERQYFETLVLFNQARDPHRKEHLFSKLTTFGDRSSVARMQRDQYEYLGTWYAVAIREYLHGNEFDGDYESLGKAVCPPVSARQARKAVELLERLGVIRSKENGDYEVVSPLLSTGAEVESLSARRYHREMADLARKAIDLPRDKRYLRGITGSFSEETRQCIIEEMDRFARRVMELIENDSGSRRVHQLNMQLFPLQQSEDEESRS